MSLLKNLKPPTQLLSYPGWFAKICTYVKYSFEKISREAKKATRCLMRRERNKGSCLGFWKFLR